MGIDIEAFVECSFYTNRAEHKPKEALQKYSFDCVSQCFWRRNSNWFNAMKALPTRRAGLPSNVSIHVQFKHEEAMDDSKEIVEGVEESMEQLMAKACTSWLTLEDLEDAVNTHKDEGSQHPFVLSTLAMMKELANTDGVAEPRLIFWFYF